MRKITVTNNLTLDGVMQAPAAKDEDTRGGFTHGGWARQYDDDVKQKEMAAGMGKPGDMLLGRRTYEHFYKVWHGRTDNPFTPVLDRARKYVVSNTLKEPLVRENSVLVTGNAVDAVARLKQDGGNDIAILGSGALIRSLLPHDLVDEMVLLIYPLIVGGGFRMFPDDGTFAKFALTKSVPTTKGVIIATYKLITRG